MGYEHERWIKHLIELRLITEGYNPNEETKAVEELKEVYAKAKAWDNYIADVRERIKFSESTEEDIEKAMQEVTNNYMEDK